MKLQSHEVTLLTPETAKTTGEYSLQLTRGEEVIDLRVGNDFATVSTEPDVISVGTLITALAKVMAAGVQVPQTHAAAWRAIHSGVGNVSQAYQYSVTQQELESAELGTLDLEFVFKSEQSGEVHATLDNAKTITVAKADFKLNSYRTLVNRLGQYRHFYSVVDGVLKIQLYVSPYTLQQAERVVSALVAMDGCYTLKINNQDQCVYSVVFPAYLVSSTDALIELLAKRTNVESYPEVTVDGFTLTIAPGVDFDNYLNGAYNALGGLEAAYAGAEN